MDLATLALMIALLTSGDVKRVLANGELVFIFLKAETFIFTGESAFAAGSLLLDWHPDSQKNATHIKPRAFGNLF